MVYGSWEPFTENGVFEIPIYLFNNDNDDDN